MDVREFVARLGLEVDSAAFEVGDSLLGKLKKGLFSIQGVALAAGGALATAVGTMAKEGGHLDDTSKALGQNVETMQALGYAAKFSGVDMQEMAQSLAFLGRNAFQATQGSQAQVDAFNALGISVKDASGHLKDSHDLFLEVADGLAKIPDAGQRTALSMSLMGRAGRQMLPVLSQGSAEIRRLEERAKTLGVVMSSDTVASADALGDSVDDLQFALKGMRNAIAEPLLKPIREVVESITEWFRANRELLKAEITPWLERIGRTVKYVAQVVGFLLRPLMWFAELLGPLVPLLAGFKVVLAIGSAAQSFVAAVVKMIATIGSYTAAQLTALGVTFLWGAAIIALILIFEDLWTGLEGGDSVVLNLLQDWSNLYDKMLAPDDNKLTRWWFLELLKDAARMLADLQGTYERFSKWVGNTSFGKAFTASNDDLMMRARMGQLTEYEKANGLGGYNPATYYGAGATPGLSVAAQPGAFQSGASVKVFQPKIELTTKVEGSNATPEQIAETNNKTLQEALGQAGREMDEAL
jgi:hypothetical protein